VRIVEQPASRSTGAAGAHADQLGEITTGMITLLSSGSFTSSVKGITQPAVRRAAHSACPFFVKHSARYRAPRVVRG
jgi:hypothetical protein